MQDDVAVPTDAGSGVTHRWTVGDVLAAVADGGAIDAWDDDLRSDDRLGFTDTKSYVDRLADAHASADRTEAVVTGATRIGGRDVAVIVGDFTFLAGTQGVVVGERMVRAFERAMACGLPVVGLPTSGGTRMQEGSLAFVQMLRIAATIAAFSRAGGRYVAWLRHPTTGGVLASWGSLARITWAQPGALLGLTGPRVIEALDGAALPDHAQRAEHLAIHGVIDDVVALPALRDRLTAVLDVVGGAPAADVGTATRPSAAGPSTAAPMTAGQLTTWPPAGATDDAWAAVRRTRAADRPGVRDLLAGADQMAWLGTGVADGCLTAVCDLAGVRVVVIGHDRAPGERGAGVGAGGYRRSREAMRLAGELGLPLVATVDTRGASTTAASESHGTAREIARCMATLSQLAVPTVAVLLGEGSGGGAIAWLAVDRVVATANAWLAPIAPEGASAILYRTTARAAELARAQAIDTASLRAIGLVDVVIDEQRPWMSDVASAVAREIRTLAALPTSELLAARARRLRSLG